jgi:hypothetical protein
VKAADVGTAAAWPCTTCVLIDPAMSAPSTSMSCCRIRCRASPSSTSVHGGRRPAVQPRQLPHSDRVHGAAHKARVANGPSKGLVRGRRPVDTDHDLRLGDIRVHLSHLSCGSQPPTGRPFASTLCEASPHRERCSSGHMTDGAALAFVTRCPAGFGTSAHRAGSRDAERSGRLPP